MPIRTILLEKILGGNFLWQDNDKYEARHSLKFVYLPEVPWFLQWAVNVIWGALKLMSTDKESLTDFQFHRLHIFHWSWLTGGAFLGQLTWKGARWLEHLQKD